MAVAYDMTFANRNLGGSGVYARSLLAALRERDDVVPRVIEGPKRSNFAATMRWLLRDASRPVNAGLTDVVHCPTFVAPWAIRVPIVVTVHDAGRFLSDHPLEWRAYVRVLMPRRLRSAARIITPSHFARKEIIHAWGLDPDKVVSIPDGLDYRFFKAPEAINEPAFLLFPGAPIRRKNLDIVLLCMAGAAEGTALARVSLQISGAREEDFPSHSRRVRTLGLERRVRWLGKLPTDDMPNLYARASVVVYPSLYEGFGLPPLEAMAAGTPVVASSRGSLPEVLGEAALLVDPADGAAMAEALEAALTEPILRHDLRERGLAQARTYTWDKCAARTVEVYREAVSAFDAHR